MSLKWIVQARQVLYNCGTERVKNMTIRLSSWIFFWTNVMFIHGSTVEECNENHYRNPNYGKCLPCVAVPLPLTEAYNQSCSSRNTCTNGYWGPKCNKICNTGCVDNTCHKKDGTCRKGCKACHSGIFCHADSNFTNCICDASAMCTCKAGYYGDGCLVRCTHNCKNKTCNINGECTRGCKTGSYGPKCDKLCNHCHNNTCSSQTGKCLEGCKAGYYRLKCTTACNKKCVDETCNQRDGRCNKCEPGLFGDTCDNVCPVNCESDFCDIVDGSCSSCRPGFTGNHCNMSCPDNCATESCHQSDGSCHGCKDGYRGSHCNTSCSGQCTICDQYAYKCSSCNTSWYGPTCHEYCDNCLGNDCDIQGKCQNGCKDGWFRDKCDGECNNGCMHKRCWRFKGECASGCIPTAYGVYCNNSCSIHCLGNLCNTSNNDKTTPSCTDGCIDSWWGDYCGDKCPRHCLRCDRSNGVCLKCELNRFGDYCSKNCSDRCSTSTCNMTGICIEVCKKGSWGLKCENDCPQHCIVCNRENGKCDQCEGSLYGRNCTMICSKACRDSQCNMTGVCTGGCRDGRHGKTCYDTCDFRCRTCDQLTGKCLSCVDGWTGELCTEPLTPTVMKHVWTLTTVVCVLVALVMIMLIRRRRLISCISSSPRGIYLSPIPHDEGELPLQDISISVNASDHPYASIAEEDISNGSRRGMQADRSYEPVGER